MHALQVTFRAMDVIVFPVERSQQDLECKKGQMINGPWKKHDI